MGGTDLVVVIAGTAVVAALIGVGLVVHRRRTRHRHHRKAPPSGRTTELRIHPGWGSMIDDDVTRPDDPRTRPDRPSGPDRRD